MSKAWCYVDLLLPREAVWDQSLPPHHMRGEGVVELNHREESLRLPSPGRFAPPGGCCAGTEWWNVCKVILECVTTHVFMKKRYAPPGRQQSHRRGWSRWRDRGRRGRWRSPSGSTQAWSCPRILSQQSRSETNNETRRNPNWVLMWINLTSKELRK